jgi:hypothetical protein
MKTTKCNVVRYYNRNETLNVTCRSQFKVVPFLSESSPSRGVFVTIKMWHLFPSQNTVYTRIFLSLSITARAVLRWPSSDVSSYLTSIHNNNNNNNNNFHPVLLSLTVLITQYSSPIMQCAGRGSSFSVIHFMAWFYNVHRPEIFFGSQFSSMFRPPD